LTNLAELIKTGVFLNEIAVALRKFWLILQKFLWPHRWTL